MTLRASITLPIEIDVKIGTDIVILRYGHYYELEEWLKLCCRFGLFEVSTDTDCND